MVGCLLLPSAERLGRAVCWKPPFLFDLLWKVGDVLQWPGPVGHVRGARGAPLGRSPAFPFHLATFRQWAPLLNLFPLPPLSHSGCGPLC